MTPTRIELASTGIPAAVEYLRAGELVAFPTETVYGLGADARREDAVRKIYEAKGRPAGNPLIVHVVDVAHARQCVSHWPPEAEALAKHFWPGPLTIILSRGPTITPLVSAGRATVAIRCPNHPVAEALLRAFGGPIAAPSANRSGFTSPTAAGHVYAELAGRIPFILDGGAEACHIGLESTVVDLSGDVPTLLRPGAITVEMLRSVLGEVRINASIVEINQSAASPGQHARHYAPRTPAYRFQAEDFFKVRRWADAHGPAALITDTEEISLPAPHETLRLSADMSAYARALYAALRDADERQLIAIFVLMPPTTAGVWAAISDRLTRATQPFISQVPR